VFSFYDDSIRQRMRREQELTNVMNEALEQGQFQVYLQPKYDLQSEHIAGAEALVRWNHPALGFISPGDFIPLFERNGFITELDRYVWDKTCGLIAEWMRKYGKYVPVSVNVSRRDIYQADLPQEFMALVQKYGLRPDQLHLEITETAYTENADQLIQVVGALKRLGFVIEMDDFGSGYSSLNMLAELPIDVLKLDMRFIQKQTSMDSSRSILSFIISLARWMNLLVIAEGVETQQQIDLLRNMDCNYVQGYYYARPMPADAFAERLRQEPVAVSALAAEDRNTDAARPGAAGRVMLIVDDVSLNRRILAGYFKNSYDIAQADNGQTALQYLQNHPEGVAVILLDLVMPVMDGFQLLKILQGNPMYAAIPVIVTSQPGETGEERAFALGASDFLAKPYNPEIALHRVQNVTAHSAYLRRQGQDRALTHQLQAILENVPGGMCVYRMEDGKLSPMVHNKAFYALFGFSEEHCRAVEQATTFLNVHPDDLSGLQEAFGQAGHGDVCVTHTYRNWNDAKNRYIWVKMNAVTTPAAGGSRLCYVSYTDVSAEHDMQEQLRQAQQRLEKLRRKAEDALQNYQLLVNAVPGGIAQYEIRDGRVLTQYFSDGICALTGYDPAEREKMNMQDALSLTCREDTPMLRAVIGSAVAGHKNIDVTYRIQTKSGALRWVHLSAAYSQGHNGEDLYQAVFSDMDKEKRIEAALKENQLRYEVAVKSSGINIWEYDIQKDSLLVVSSSVRIKQNCFVIEHYVQSTLTNGFVREDSLPKFRSIFDRLRSGTKEVSEDIWYKTTDQTGWWCERVTYTTMFDAAGRPVKAFGAGRDVTREMEARRSFQEEMSYRKALQSENLSSLMVDLTNNRVLELSSRFSAVQALEGVTADEYFAATAAQITDTQQQENFRRMFSRQVLLSRFSGGGYSASMEFTRLFDTDTVYWVHYAAHLVQNPGTHVVMAHLSSMDITQEKVMQTIMDTVAKTDYDYFVVVDGSRDSARDYAVKSGGGLGGHLFDEHRSFEAQYEAYVRARVCPQDVERVVAESRIDRIWANVKDGTPHRYSFSIRMADGTVRRKQIQVTAISESRKTFLMSCIDVNDIYEEQETAKTRLREALQAAEQASRAKSEFLSRMSHDIRTPMNAVITLAAMGRQETTLPAARDDLSKISAAGEYLLAIINDVLGLSRMESKRIELHPTVVCLPDFLRDTLAIVAPAAAQKGVVLTISQQNIRQRYLRLDTTYVRQVAVNLLSNAVKFTPSGGHVELRLENISRSGDTVRNRMIVRDNGIGISPEFLPRVFEPFEQENSQDDTGRQGTGLGLSIVKNILDLMGGTITAESQKGVGTAFTVEWTFQTAAKKDFEAQSRPSEAGGCLAGRHVLLAEDNTLNAVLAQRLLEKEGITVETVENGKLAVEHFAAAGPGTFDAILMDIRMPELNGLDAARAIRAMKRADAATVPILAMTANAFDEDVKASRDAGMNAHLGKPIDPEKLFEALERLIKTEKDTAAPAAEH
jgi:PAS domain S-box-containing protein